MPAGGPRPKQLSQVDALPGEAIIASEVGTDPDDSSPVFDGGTEVLNNGVPLGRFKNLNFPFGGVVDSGAGVATINVAGATGPTGSGSTGATGSTGLTGSGMIGATGVTGATGPPSGDDSSIILPTQIFGRSRGL